MGLHDRQNQNQRKRAKGIEPEPGPYAGVKRWARYWSRVEPRYNWWCRSCGSMVGKDKKCDCTKIKETAHLQRLQSLPHECNISDDPIACMIRVNP